MNENTEANETRQEEYRGTGDRTQHVYWGINPIHRAIFFSLFCVFSTLYVCGKAISATRSALHTAQGNPASQLNAIIKDLESQAPEMAAVEFTMAAATLVLTVGIVVVWNMISWVLGKAK